MSFLIKGVLRKILQQYLNVQDQISLDKGHLHLPSGHLNHNNINAIPALINLGLTMLYSEYLDLSVSLPILQIMSKPIHIKVERLQLVLSIDTPDGNQVPPSDDLKTQKQLASGVQQEKPQPEGYVKGLINRLLTNMELQIKYLMVTIRRNSSEYRLVIRNLNIKNSLSLLQANLLKKIVCLQQLSVSSSTYVGNKKEQGELKECSIGKILDLNMSVNIDHKKFCMMCLVDEISLQIPIQQLQMVIQKVKKKSESKKIKNKKQNPQQSKQQIPKVENFQLKINKINLGVLSSSLSQKTLLSAHITNVDVLHQKKMYSTSIYDVSLQNLSIYILDYPQPFFCLKNSHRSQHSLCLQKETNRKIKEKAKVQIQIYNKTEIGHIKVQNFDISVLMMDGISKNIVSAVNWANKLIQPTDKKDQQISKPQFYGIKDIKLQISDISINAGLMMGSKSHIKQEKEIIMLCLLIPEQQMLQIRLLMCRQLGENKRELKTEPKLLSFIVSCSGVRVSLSETDIITLNSVNVSKNIKVKDEIQKILEGDPDLVNGKPLCIQNSCDGEVRALNSIVGYAVFESSLLPFVHRSEIIGCIHNLQMHLASFIFGQFMKVGNMIPQQMALMEKIQKILGQNQDHPHKTQVPKQSIKLYLRMDNAVISVGQLNQQHIYLPIFIFKLSPSKLSLQTSPISPSWRLKTTFKSISAISPQTITSNTLLKNPIHLQAHHHKGQFHFSINDPLTLQVQQEHIALLLSFIASSASQNQHSTMFITLQNLLDMPITLTEQKQSTNRKNSNMIKQTMTIPMKPMQFDVEGGGKCELYLCCLENLRVIINGEHSQPIILKQNCRQVEKDIYQVGILFNYHEQCKYILQVITINQFNIILRVKPKYQLHLFKGLEKQCLPHIASLLIQCGKFNKRSVYEWNGGDKNMILMDWEMMEEDKIEHLCIKIGLQGDKTCQQFTVHRLMANSMKYKMYGLQPKGVETSNYQYYILQQTPQELNQKIQRTHAFYLMPFLIINNQLRNSAIYINMKNTKIPKMQLYQLNPSSSSVPKGNYFDYYMKQFVIQLTMNSKLDQNLSGDSHKKQGNQEFISEEHYFNTFFMVDESFQSLIELRSAKNKKRYLRIRQSFVLKTKILSIEECLNISNTTEYPLEISIIQNNKTGMEEMSEIGYPLQNWGGVSLAMKLKRDQIFRVTYLGGEQQNSIDVPISNLMDSGNKVVLSFNFCHGRDRQRNEGSGDKKQQFCQIMIKMEVTGGSSDKNLQKQIKFSSFLKFYNLCGKKKITLNGCELETGLWDPTNCYQTSLQLPSNSNKQYNNTFMPVNGLSIEKIYNDLLAKRHTWVCHSGSKFTKIILDPQSHKYVYLDDLITHKMIQYENQIYSLVKILQNQCIQLYFSDRFVNLNSNHRYFIIKNDTQQHFLMNPPETGYGRFLFSSDSQPQTMLQNGSSQEDIGQLTKKVHIAACSNNMMLDKDKYQILLCDKEYTHLESLSTQKLQKYRIKHQRYQIQNFSVVSFSPQPSSNIAKNLSSHAPNFQFTTNTICCKVLLKSKTLVMQVDVRNLNVRIFENNKADFLVRDISVAVGSETQSNGNEQNSPINSGNKIILNKVLRVPQESYILLQGQSFGDKIVLLRNVFLKCKIIDVNIHHHILKFIAHFNKLMKNLQPNIPVPQKPSQDKIRKLAQQPIFLLRSLYAHPINLCLSVKTTPNMDFSNMITIPELTLTSKSFRPPTLAKQFINHYLTNIVAKFPKLTFLYHNIRSPLSLLKSIVEIHQTFSEEDEKEKRKLKQSLFQSFIDLHANQSNRKKNEEPLSQHQRINNFFVQNSFLKNSKVLKKRSSRKEGLRLEQKNKEEKEERKQTLMCVIRNVVFCNISKLNQISNLRSPLTYYITNSRVCIYSKDLPMEAISLKEIQCAKVTRYNKINAQLTINFRRPGCYMKIMDEFSACQHLVGILKSLII